ncbi:MAG: hypothetical protein DMG76_34580, partial [Acidobacteria bacterium]
MASKTPNGCGQAPELAQAGPEEEVATQMLKHEWYHFVILTDCWESLLPELCQNQTVHPTGLSL